jgi:hypothetical protein
MESSCSLIIPSSIHHMFSRMPKPDSPGFRAGRDGSIGWYHTTRHTA